MAVGFLGTVGRKGCLFFNNLLQQNVTLSTPMHITHGGWEGSHTCTLGFHKGAVARQVIYR